MLFIDANIYLEFFKTNQAQIGKLLPALKEIKADIFVTTQVVDEVRRNKVSAALSWLGKYLTEFQLPPVTLPLHLDGFDPNQRAVDLNAKAKQLADDAKAHREAMTNWITGLISHITAGQDAASKTLDEIFATAISPTPEELNAARKRREVGNPPGKMNNPLGDQISWEQLLTRFDGKSPLIIVSKDDDYSVKFGKGRLPNPFLVAELQKKFNAAVQILVFDSLAEALRYFSSLQAERLAALPADAELRDIAQAEATSEEILFYRELNGPGICPFCKGDKFDGPVAKPSTYGGWTFQWRCRKCSLFVDLGVMFQ